MVAHNDYYTNYTKVAGGQDAEQFCKWTPEYKNPCSGSSTKSGNASGSTGDSDDNNAAIKRLVSTALIICSVLLALNLKSLW